MQELTGMTASPGTAKGKVCINKKEFREGQILVTIQTTPEDTPIIAKSSGVITQQGGLLSHAAITSREMGIPCIVNVKNILKNVKEGQEITMTARGKEGKIKL